MHSPPVQPISSSSAGTGSVITMWEEAIERRPRSGQRRPFAAPPIASTALSARTTPAAVRASTTPARRLRLCTGEDSKTSTPAASSRPRRPSASRAGCTVAASGKKTPPRKAGEAQRSATCAGLSSCAASASPSSRQAATAAKVESSKASAVETLR